MYCFKPKAEKDTVSGRELEIEMRKWLIELRILFLKLVPIYLAPTYLKNRFREEYLEGKGFFNIRTMMLPVKMSGIL